MLDVLSIRALDVKARKKLGLGGGGPPQQSRHRNPWFIGRLDRIKIAIATQKDIYCCSFEEFLAIISF